MKDDHPPLSTAPCCAAHGLAEEDDLCGGPEAGTPLQEDRQKAPLQPSRLARLVAVARPRCIGNEIGWCLTRGPQFVSLPVRTPTLRRWAVERDELAGIDLQRHGEARDPPERRRTTALHHVPEVCSRHPVQAVVERIQKYAGDREAILAVLKNIAEEIKAGTFPPR